MKKKTKKTYIAIVLDRSGSMHSNKEQTVSGYNEQVQEIKANAANDKDSQYFVSLVTFNGSVYEHLWNEDAEKLEEATVESYLPTGSTAMYDAMGYTIDKLTETTKDEKGDVAYLMLVISDGENNINEGSISALRERIDSCERTGKWTFTYMGCSAINAEKICRLTGLKKENVAAWSNTATPDMAAAAYRGTRNAMKGYMLCRSAGMEKMDNFYTASNEAAVGATGVVDFTSPVVVNSLNSLADNTNQVNQLYSSNKADVFAKGSEVKWKS